MSDTPIQVLIISRDALLRVHEEQADSHVFRALAKITRQGVHLLLTAPEPEQWLPTRGSMDGVLTRQGILQESLSDAGGDLDGVYYVPRSLFTQDRNREGALRDILERYSVGADQAVLISASVPFIKAAQRLHIATYPLADKSDSAQAIEKVLNSIFDN